MQNLLKCENLWNSCYIDIHGIHIEVAMSNPDPFLERFDNPMEYPSTYFHVVCTKMKVHTISVSMET